MKVTVCGMGYVGLVQATVLAEVGHDVICVDVDSVKVEALKRGVIPIYEPGLTGLVRKNAALGRLQFTTDAASSIKQSEIIFIAVGTPSDSENGADLQYVISVAASIGAEMNRETIIVNKSTVPVGTAARVKEVIQSSLDRRGLTIPFEVVSNPEFLREGSALADCMHPDRIVVGCYQERSRSLLTELYAPFNKGGKRIIFMSPRSAELTKYAANAFLATKISFINEMATLAEKFGADIEAVRQGMGRDRRIGLEFLAPGCGYGGSCFPKDVRALIHSAQQAGYPLSLLQSVESVNQAQKHKLFTLIHEHFTGEIAGRHFALWGLAFKPDTDDMREAPSQTLIAALLAAGATIAVYDPKAMNAARNLYAKTSGITFAQTPLDAVIDADGLILATEWSLFRTIDLSAVTVAIKNRVLFDGRNIYDPTRLAELGWTYYGIGRRSTLEL